MEVELRGGGAWRYYAAIPPHSTSMPPQPPPPPSLSLDGTPPLHFETRPNPKGHGHGAGHVDDALPTAPEPHRHTARRACNALHRCTFITNPAVPHGLPPLKMRFQGHAVHPSTSHQSTPRFLWFPQSCRARHTLTGAQLTVASMRLEP